MIKAISNTVVFTLLGLFYMAVGAQNHIPQNKFGQHRAHELLAVENNKLRREALVPPKAEFIHSETVVLESVADVLQNIDNCADYKNDVIYSLSDRSFEYAMSVVSGKKWESVIQDCWVFVKVTIPNTKIPADIGDDFFYFRSIYKLERLGVFDESNVQYSLRGSQEVFNQRQGEVTVSISAFRAADIYRYR